MLDLEPRVSTMEVRASLGRTVMRSLGSAPRKGDAPVLTGRNARLGTSASQGSDDIEY
jgi:hypothetical protein